ncbi:MAG: hypothetical protein JRH10_21040 [Deltaproteobacteria bacterium]|nr:hypothetical protein [Deltaproteobacteria bacterium]MBW2446564.1 hypothetical protein [Deltaproteobacteria bacterium]
MRSVEDRSGDLVFGEGPRAVVVDGAADFREVESADPRRRGWLLGEWIGAGLPEAVATGEFGAGFGRFVALVHDRERRRLEVHVDRHGLMPFFRVSSRDPLLLCARVQPLLDRGLAQGSLDHTALAQALAFHTPLGPRTLVTDVASVGPGAKLVVDLESGNVEKERSWDPAVPLSGEGEPYEALREEIVEAFLEGFGRCVAGEGPIGVTLSGGIDSRCLLAAGFARGLPIEAYNASVPGSRSALYAERLAAMTAASLHAHGVGMDFAEGYAARLRGVVELCDGLTFSSEVEAHWLREYADGPTVMLHGAFGELSKLGKMHFHELVPPVAGAPREGLVEAHWSRFASHYEKNVAVLAPDLRASLGDRARETLAERVDGVDPAFDAARVMQVLYFEEFMAKVTKWSARVWNDRLPTRFPFAYPRYVDALLRVRSEDRLTQPSQMDILRRTAPELFRFPDGNTGARVDSPRWLIQALTLANKVRTVLTASRKTLDHSDRLTWLAGMKPSAREILFDESAADLFDRAAIEQTLDFVLGNTPAPVFGPVAAVRHRIARHGFAEAIQKALQLQFWREYSGVRGI